MTDLLNLQWRTLMVKFCMHACIRLVTHMLVTWVTTCVLSTSYWILLPNRIQSSITGQVLVVLYVLCTPFVLWHGLATMKAAYLHSTGSPFLWQASVQLAHPCPANICRLNVYFLLLWLNWVKMWFVLYQMIIHIHWYFFHMCRGINQQSTHTYVEDVTVEMQRFDTHRYCIFVICYNSC